MPNTMKVSVPSRGLSYLNRGQANKEKENENVSVPSRGLSYLNYANVTFSRRYTTSRFRPLTGTLLSKREKVEILSMMDENGFRPLTGTLLSKPSFKTFKDCSFIVSVPSRGLSYLNTIRQFSLPKRLFSLVCVANDILMIKEFNVFI